MMKHQIANKETSITKQFRKPRPRPPAALQVALLTHSTQQHVEQTYSTFNLLSSAASSLWEIRVHTHTYTRNQRNCFKTLQHPYRLRISCRSVWIPVGRIAEHHENSLRDLQKPAEQNINDENSWENLLRPDGSWRKLYGSYALHIPYSTGHRTSSPWRQAGVLHS